jgi:hypothetical protein
VDVVRTSWTFDGGLVSAIREYSRTHTSAMGTICANPRHVEGSVCSTDTRRGVLQRICSVATPTRGAPALQRRCLVGCLSAFAP